MTKAELEARRLEYEQSIRFVGWDEDCIFSAMNGFDFAAALLQGEIDALKGCTEVCSVHEKCMWFSALESQKSNYETAVHRMEKAQSQLQSANAKLMLAIEKLTSISKNSCCDNCQEAKLVALEALTAMDASEGKGNKNE